MKKQSGSAHVIIVIVLVIALLGSLGFIFWQNFVNKTTNSDTIKTGDTSATNKTTKSEETKSDSNLGYVVVKEWGIKIKSKLASEIEYKLDTKQALKVVDRTPQSTDELYEHITFTKKGGYGDLDCPDTQGGFYREKIASAKISSDSQENKNIGEYRYFSSNLESPYSCPGTKSEAIHAEFQNEFMKVLKPINIEVL